MKIVNIKENSVGIIGENILVNNNTVTAYYILSPVNYSITNKAGVSVHIREIESILSSLANKRKDLKFSIFNIDKVITPRDVAANLIDTVHMYDPHYNGIPEIFRRNINKQYQNYSLLAIDINTTDIADIESLSIGEIIKELMDRTAKHYFSMQNVNIDTERIANIENEIYRTINSICVRASKELVFYNYISGLFPNYEISYNNNSFISDHMSPIIGSIQQQITSKFGYFEMSNSGLYVFGYEPQVTYGSVIDIVDMPKAINISDFRMNINNLRINCNILSRDKLKTKLKRVSADIDYEREGAQISGARRGGGKELQESKSLSELAIDTLESGNYICELSASILILANDLETLKEKKTSVITSLASKDITAAISFNQASDYINGFIKHTPEKYNQLTDLAFPLSFQIDDGVNVGDNDSKFFSPSIGVSASRNDGEL